MPPIEISDAEKNAIAAAKQNMSIFEAKIAGVILKEGKATNCGESLYTLVEDAFVVIDSGDAYVNYCNLYVEALKTEGLHSLKRIIFQKCILKTFIPMNAEYGIALDKCIIENTIDNNIQITAITDCEIRSRKNQDFTLYAANTERTVFMEGCITGKPNYLSDNLIERQYIKQCVFLKKIESTNPSYERLVIADSYINGFLNTNQSVPIEINNTQIGRLTVVNRAPYLRLVKNRIHNTSVHTEVFPASFHLIENEFLNPLTFYAEAKLVSKDCVIRSNTYRDRSSNEALGTFRQLKKMCEDAGYEHGAIEFHGYELETYYNNTLKNAWCSKDCVEALSSIAHKMFSDYGRNPARPLFWVGFFWLVGFIRYQIDLCGSLFLEQTFYESLRLNFPYFDVYEHVAKFSLRNVSGPLFFALPREIREVSLPMESFWGHAVAFSQISLCALIWFLLVFMVRRRFKL